MSFAHKVFLSPEGLSFSQKERGSFTESRNHPKPPYSSLLVHSHGSRHDDTPHVSALEHSDGRVQIILKLTT